MIICPPATRASPPASPDRDDLPAGVHERHRRWTPLVADLAPGWRELRRIDPPADVGLLAGFVVHGRADA
jgi:hypothetical protein